MLTMDKLEGRISISAKLFSKDGRIIAELQNNKFFVNPNNIFRKEQADHSLIIFDQEDTEVLNVQFINPSTIRFLGVIRHPRLTTPLVISKNKGIFANTICAGD